MGLDFSHGDLKAGLGWDHFLQSLAAEAGVRYDTAKRCYTGKGRGKNRDPILELLNAEFQEDGRAYIFACGPVATRIRELVRRWEERWSGGDGRKEFAIRLAEALEEAEQGGEAFCMWW